jgi:hypothetical protein
MVWREPYVRRKAEVDWEETRVISVLLWQCESPYQFYSRETY